jgi:hypothetical protein
VAGKLNLPGAPMDGVFIVGDMTAGGTVSICEGIGQAWAGSMPFRVEHYALS